MVCLNLSSRSQPIPAKESKEDIHSQEESDGVTHANELSPSRYLSTQAWEMVLPTVGRSYHISKHSSL